MSDAPKHPRHNRGRPRREGPPLPKLGRNIYVTGITMRQIDSLRVLLGSPERPVAITHVLELAVEDFYMKHVEKLLAERKRLPYNQLKHFRRDEDETVSTERPKALQDVPGEASDHEGEG